MSKLTLYKASAGSGKTYTLTQEYLRLLLSPGTKARNILAITFTNAATADMKRKIVEALAREAEKNPDAGRKLAEILHEYQDFSIKTIDSFVQSIIKPFAFELGLPRNYTPQIDEAGLSATITENILDRFGRKGEETLGNYIKKYLKQSEQAQKSLKIGEKINAVVSLLFKEKYQDGLKSIENLDAEDFQTAIDNIKTYTENCERQAEEILCETRRIIEENNLSAKDFHGGSRGAFTLFSMEKPDMGKIANPTSTVEKNIADGILKSRPDLSDDFEDAYRKLQALDFPAYFLLKEIQIHIYAVALLGYAREELEKLKEKTAEIPLSEFNRKIDEALSKEGNEFIFERSGNRYHHIFIDEFQDTSRLQWKNLRPLITNNLAQGTGCMIVGDAKQSLYRFRGADMEQFVNLYEGGDKEIAVDVKELKSNWRSAPGIIAFNNIFYDFLKTEFGFGSETDKLQQKVYEHHEQYYRDKTDALPEGDAEAVEIRQIVRVDKDVAQDWYLRKIIEILSRHKSGDVAVLCHKNEHCRIVADFLVQNGYKVSTPDSLLLSTHNGIRLLMASLQYIHAKEGFYKAQVYTLAQRLGFWNVAENASEKAPSGEASEMFERYENWISPETERRFQALADIGLRQADLYDTVQAVIRFWGMDKKADQYLLCLLDNIQSQNLRQIPDLVQWYKDFAANTSLAGSATEDSVRIMSIHKSKGLEFKVVILPFISDHSLRNDSLFWTGHDVIPAEIGLPDALVRYVGNMENTRLREKVAEEKQHIEIDNLNAFYVATTRPCQKLYLLNHVPKQGKSAAFNANIAIARFVEAHPEYLKETEDGGVLTEEGAANGEGVWNEGETRSGKVAANGEGGRSEDGAADSLMESHPWRERLQAAGIEDSQTSPEQEWGNFIHAALSFVETASEAHIARAVGQAALLYPEFRDRKEEALQHLRALCTHPLLKEYFNGDYQSKTEVPIADGGNIFIPDRLLLKERAAVIIDYKTGEPHQRYTRQVQNYMQLLSRMGYTTKGFIVYLSPLKIEEIS